MDKRIEYAMNTLINTEIWSTNLYLSLQVYFEGSATSDIGLMAKCTGTGQYGQGLSDDEPHLS